MVILMIIIELQNIRCFGEGAAGSKRDGSVMKIIGFYIYKCVFPSFTLAAYLG
jgi:hypothetical protein